MKNRVPLVLTLTLCLAASAVRAQDPKGPELRVNQRTPGAQWQPDVAIAPDGHFVAVWREGGERLDSPQPAFVTARLFDAAGRPRSPEIRVARLTANTPFWRLAVDMAPDGRFVVVWNGGVENPRLAFGRRFAADGRPLGARFRLAKNEDRQEEPDVAMAPDGSFVAVWTQQVEGNAEVNTDVYMRRFGSDGRPLGPEDLAIGDFEEESAPRISMRPNGDFVIACREWSDPYDVDARVFLRDGTPVTDTFLVSDGPTMWYQQEDPAVAVAADGTFAVAWTDGTSDVIQDPSLVGTEAATGVRARFYAPDGTPLGPDLPVNTFRPGVQAAPAVSALPNGGFLVLWMSGAAQDGDGTGIFARVYGPDGQPRGREFRINLNRTGAQGAPALAIAPNGKGVAAWQGPDGDGFGVFARRIGLPGQGS
jgi:hypothetical protein